jgi:hypothetical protein
MTTSGLAAAIPDFQLTVAGDNVAVNLYEPVAFENGRLAVGISFL